MILVCTTGFSSMPDLVVWSKITLNRHCILGKIQDGRHLA